jgi:hypothetical protein
MLNNGAKVQYASCFWRSNGKCEFDYLGERKLATLLIFAGRYTKPKSPQKRQKGTEGDIIFLY